MSSRQGKNPLQMHTNWVIRTRVVDVWRQLEAEGKGLYACAKKDPVWFFTMFVRPMIPKDNSSGAGVDNLHFHLNLGAAAPPTAEIERTEKEIILPRLTGDDNISIDTAPSHDPPPLNISLNMIKEPIK